MRTLLVLLFVAVLALLALPACQSSSATPPEVQAAYGELVASLDPGAPGLSLLRLREFARRHAKYEIAARLDQDAATWRSRLQPAYLEARELVREGHYDEAEWVLKDLALVPDEPAGKQSTEFLAFEFHKMKASRLLVAGDTTGAEEAARNLVGRELGGQQMEAAQQLLDTVATARLGAHMMRTTALQSSARTLQVFLHSSYADNGQYPHHLTLDDPELAYLRETGALDAIGSLEGYDATQDAFSVIVTGRGSTERLRITHRGIEPLPPPVQP